MPNLKGKTVVIVGVGQIGFAIARGCYEAGANLVLARRDLNKLKEQQAALGKDRVLIQAADATNPDDIARLYQLAKEPTGRIDAIVITTGEWKRLRIKDSLDTALRREEEDYRTFYRTVFVSGFIGQKILTEQEGESIIIHLSSHIVVRPDLDGNLSYGPHKTGADDFIGRLRVEFEKATPKLSIYTTNIRPGTVYTEKNAEEFLDTPEKRAEAIPLEEIVNPILGYIADPKSAPPMLLLERDMDLD